MNSEFLLIIMSSLSIFILLMGIYQNSLGKKESAKENIRRLVGQEKETDPTEFRKQQENILKKRTANEKSNTEWLENNLERANLMIKPSEFYIICVVSAFLVGVIATFAFGMPMILGGLTGAMGFFLPFLMLNMKIGMRMGKADAEFPDILDALVNCFKTGYGFSRAIQVIAENYDDPWGTEFGKVALEMNLGSTQEDALYNLSKRIVSPDVDLFVTGLIIQKETGGNMAELLTGLSGTIRERYKMFRKISALSAQGKLSAGIICAIPFAMMGMMSLAMPAAVTGFVTHPIGILLLGVAGFWMACGIAVLFKIVKVEV
jgi:tight adherence protein B